MHKTQAPEMRGRAKHDICKFAHLWTGENNDNSPVIKVARTTTICHMAPYPLLTPLPGSGINGVPRQRCRVAAGPGGQDCLTSRPVPRWIWGGDPGQIACILSMLAGGWQSGVRRAGWIIHICTGFLQPSSLRSLDMAPSILAVISRGSACKTGKVPPRNEVLYHQF